MSTCQLSKIGQNMGHLTRGSARNCAYIFFLNITKIRIGAEIGLDKCFREKPIYVLGVTEAIKYNIFFFTLSIDRSLEWRCSFVSPGMGPCPRICYSSVPNWLTFKQPLITFTNTSSSSSSSYLSWSWATC